MGICGKTLTRFAPIVLILTINSAIYGSDNIHTELRPEADGQDIITLKDGSKHFVGHSDAATRFPYEIDLDGDGKLDLVVEDYWEDGNDISVYLSKDDSLFMVLFASDVYEDFQIIDMDIDGVKEILIYKNLIDDNLFAEFYRAPVVYAYVHATGQFEEKSIACFPAFRTQYLSEFDMETRKILHLRATIGGPLGRDSFPDDIAVQSILNNRVATRQRISEAECNQ